MQYFTIILSFVCGMLAALIMAALFFPRKQLFYVLLSSLSGLIIYLVTSAVGLTVFSPIGAAIVGLLGLGGEIVILVAAL